MHLETFSQYLRLDCGLSQNTITAYLSDVTPLLEKKPLREISRDTIRAYLEKLQNTGVSQRSLARKLSALRLFFKFAVESQLVTQNPIEDLQTPKVGKALPKTLSFTQVENLLEVASKNERGADGVMLRLMYASGLRVSELICLKANDLDLQSSSVRVRGKGEKIRIVPFDPETSKLLDTYINQVRPQLILKSKISSDQLFLSRLGKPFTRQGFWKLVKRYAIAAGINDPVSPHILRHAFATHLLERGINLRSLQMLLGHSDISTTEIYSHVSNSHLHEILKKYHPKGGSQS